MERIDSDGKYKNNISHIDISFYTNLDYSDY
jgi:hypothetical protein